MFSIVSEPLHFENGYFLYRIVGSPHKIEGMGPELCYNLFRQNTYLRNKKHMLTCQGGTGCYRTVNYQPGS